MYHVNKLSAICCGSAIRKDEPCQHVRFKRLMKEALDSKIGCRFEVQWENSTVFVSLEDESGIANAIVRSELFEKLRLTITQESFLEIEGTLQTIEGVISVFAKDVRGVSAPAAIEAQSYDFR